MCALVYIVAEIDVSDPLPDVDCCNIKVSCVNVTERGKREREEEQSGSE